MQLKFYEVGGAVRDSLLGLDSKDVDFAVEAQSFVAMVQGLETRGFKIFLSNPEFFTVRAQVPPTESALLKRTKVADFVMCRKDSPTGDGRRPDYVEAGTIYDDLARRDFTVNAIARDTHTGELLDPHNGQADLKQRKLRFVGDAMTRIKEDGLRILRAIRFMVTKDLHCDGDTRMAITHQDSIEMLGKVSIERVREELDKMFAYDTLHSMYLLQEPFGDLREAIFRDGLRLMPTLKKD